MKVVHIQDATPTTAIYALCEYPSWEVRYVGKTIQYLHERHNAHIRSAKRGGSLPVACWIRKKIRNGERLAIRLIEYVSGDKDWSQREAFWIKHYRGGGRLLNLTEGGEGLAGHRFSESHRRKIASALRTGAECSCQRCGKTFWRKASAIKRGHSKYCSRVCSNSRHKGVGDGA